MKYGVCRTFIKDDGRAQHPVWWDGNEWKTEPIYAGPFDSEIEAGLWVKENITNLPPVQHHVYGEGDPFGGQRVTPGRLAPTKKQLEECGVEPQNVIPPQSEN